MGRSGATSDDTCSRLASNAVHASPGPVFCACARTWMDKGAQPMSMAYARQRQEKVHSVGSKARSLLAHRSAPQVRPLRRTP